MYITIEGIDTAGKSTQLDRLSKLYPDAIFTKEPGGTATGEKIRSIILEDQLLSSKSELFLFLADRSEHIDSVIKPNINSLIISDRSVVSGMAYALAKSEFCKEDLLSLHNFATDGILPDLCIILELSKPLLNSRLGAKRQDVIEMRGEEYLLEIQKNLCIACDLLEIKSVNIDASLSMELITEKISQLIRERA